MNRKNIKAKRKLEYGLANSGSLLAILGGVVASAITGYYSLKLLMVLIKKEKLYYFSPYLILSGSLALYIWFSS